MSAVAGVVQRRDWSGELKAVGYRLLAVVVMCVALALVSDAFLTWNNVLNVLRQAALLFLLASGLTLVILTAGLDLSVGANVALSACLAGTVMKATGSPLLGTVVGLGCGTADRRGERAAHRRRCASRRSSRRTACSGWCTA